MVSVIIPNYNHADYLDQRIQSVLSQTHRDFELIILDDVSIDKSLQVIDKYANDPKVSKVITNNKNSGSSISQWKKGILEAKGEFIWIAESDDYCESNFIEKVLPPLLNSEEIVLSYAQSLQVDEKGAVIKNMIEEVAYISSRWERNYINAGAEELKNYFCLINTIPNASGVIFRKSTVLKFIDRMDLYQNFKLVGDKMFWTDLLLHGNVAFNSSPLNYFRKHTNNVRSNSSSKQNLIDNFKWYGYLTSKVEVSYRNKRLVRNRLFGWWFMFIQHPFDYFKESNLILRKYAGKLYKPLFGWFIFLYVKFFLNQMIHHD